jgi:hypothetical protein
MIGIGMIALYQGVYDPCVQLRGQKRPLRVWQGRIFYAVLTLMGIGGGVAVWFGPF